MHNKDMSCHEYMKPSGQLPSHWMHACKKQQAKRVADRLKEKKISLHLEDSAIDFLAQKGFDPVFGAR
eukprot:351965-Chlamydomonas_euryale.AAC.6